MTYWTVGSLPELAHLPECKRRRLLQATLGRFYYVRLVAQSVLIGGLIGGLVAAAAGRLLNIPPSPPVVALAWILFLSICVFWYRFILWRVRLKMRLEIMRLLEGEKVPVCLRCGYIVEDSPGETCPECGAGLVVPRETQAR